MKEKELHVEFANRTSAVDFANRMLAVGWDVKEPFSSVKDGKEVWAVHAVSTPIARASMKGEPVRSAYAK